jgi:hypothetical protein
MFLGMVKSSFPPAKVLDISLELYIAKLTVVVEVLGTPEVVVTLGGIWVLSPGVLVDLEELAGTIGGGCILNLGHVCEDRAPVGTTKTFFLAVACVMLVHLNGHCVTGLEVALSFSCSGADVALKSVAGVVFNRAVGRWQPGTSAFKILSVLPELLESGMGVGQRQDGGEYGYGFHTVYVDASSDVWNE